MRRLFATETTPLAQKDWRLLLQGKHWMTALARQANIPYRTELRWWQAFCRASGLTLRPMQATPEHREASSPGFRTPVRRARPCATRPTRAPPSAPSRRGTGAPGSWTRSCVLRKRTPARRTPHRWPRPWRSSRRSGPNPPPGALRGPSPAHGAPFVDQIQGTDMFHPPPRAWAARPSEALCVRAASLPRAWSRLRPMLSVMPTPRPPPPVRGGSTRAGNLEDKKMSSLPPARVEHPSKTRLIISILTPSPRARGAPGLGSSSGSVSMIGSHARRGSTVLYGPSGPAHAYARQGGLSGPSGAAHAYESQEGLYGRQAAALTHPSSPLPRRGGETRPGAVQASCSARGRLPRCFSFSPHRAEGGGRRAEAGGPRVSGHRRRGLTP